MSGLPRFVSAAISSLPGSRATASRMLVEMDKYHATTLSRAVTTRQDRQKSSAMPSLRRAAQQVRWSRAADDRPARPGGHSLRCAAFMRRTILKRTFQIFGVVALTIL